MSNIEPIQLRAFQRRSASGSGDNDGVAHSPTRPGPSQIAFTRQELSAILAVYGCLMAEGECRDYAMDFGRENAVFSIFRRASEVPLYRIEKSPKLARQQGTYAVIASTGLIFKRGHELPRVLEVLMKKVRVVGR